MTVKRLVTLTLAAGLAGVAALAQTPAPTPATPPVPVVAPTAPGQHGFGEMPGMPGWDGHMRMWQNQSKASQLAKKLATTEKPEEKQDLQKKLHDLVGEQFDENMKRQQKELDALEKELTELRTTLKKRQDAKSQIVDRRVEQLILDAQGLGWGSGSHANAFWFESGTPAPPAPPAKP